MSDFSVYINSFKEYASSFYCEDTFINENIDLKINHTLRVCDLMDRLTTSIKLDNKKKFLAFLVALYHDLGRFKQMATYRTFSDKISENHAHLSVKELEVTKFIYDLDKEEQNLIIKSILNHNKFEIEADDSDKDIILFSKLIRDADKLDIFRVITDYYTERYEKPNEAIELHFKEEGEISPHIVEDIFNKRLSNNLYIKNAYDMRVLRIGWVFDLNFSESFLIYKEKGYLDKSMEALPKNDLIKKIYDFVNDYIEEKIKTA